MKLFKSQFGFTLIELLVVIAIIGVLSSIVLSSLNTARNKGNDAAAKSNLDNARAQAELFYDANGNKYVVTTGGTTDVCSPTGSVGTPAVKGIYASVNASAQAAGATTLNVAIGTTGAVGRATCHACYKGQAVTSCVTDDQWAAEVPLKTGGFYCVDSTGVASTTPAFTLGAGDARCF